MKLTEKKISDLKPAEYNPRTLSERQFDEIKASLKEFGFVDPIIVNTHKGRENVIVGGHQRSKVWGAMGNDTVPAVEVNLSLKKEKELNVRLNKAKGSWDWDILANEFEALDLIGWGFSESDFSFGSEFDEITAEVTDINLELNEALEEANIKMVQIYLTAEQHDKFMGVVNSTKEEGDTITSVVYKLVTNE